MDSPDEASQTAPTGAVEVVLAGERALLLPERALWLPDHQTLLVADLHWGKAAAFRSAQLPIPVGTTADDLTRLTRALRLTATTRLVVLGDLAHARDGWHPATIAQLAEWREAHAALVIDLVRGNHDQQAGDPPVALRIACHDGPLAIGALTLCHEPSERAPAGGGYQVGGHFHPSVTLTGAGRQRLRLPAFIIGRDRALLPAFTAFSGGGMYRPQTEDHPFVVAEGEVMPALKSGPSL